MKCVKAEGINKADNAANRVLRIYNSLWSKMMKKRTYNVKEFLQITDEKIVIITERQYENVF